jgi:hypothetical protein
MAKDVKEELKKREKEGWIKSIMMIEAMAISEEAVASSLKKHVEKIEKEPGTLVYSQNFHDVKEVEKPLPNIEKGYSQVVEIEVMAENFEKMVMLVLTYGPSALEIIEPESVKLDMGDMQNILATLAMVVHRFAAMQGGGLIVNT